MASSNLGLITLDAYRVGAQEQLRTYGRILGVPVHTAHDRASLEDLLDLLSAKTMVLIDTAGMAQRDVRTRELLDMLSHRSIQKLLVVNAAAQGETIEDVMIAYHGATCRGMVISKLDEAVKLGPGPGRRDPAQAEGRRRGQRPACARRLASLVVAGAGAARAAGAGQPELETRRRRSQPDLRRPLSQPRGPSPRRCLARLNPVMHGLQAPPTVQARFEPYGAAPRAPASDQADGLRRLFGAQRPRFVAVVANAEMAFSGLVLERLASACSAAGRHTLVVDAATSAPVPHELVALDLAAGIDHAGTGPGLPGRTGPAAAPCQQPRLLRRLSASHQRGGAHGRRGAGAR